jgi:hypothetical protein
VADRTPPLSVEELHALVASGEIDTVVLAFPDMQGRLQGKRFAARFFLDDVLEHGTEGCNYLLAVDTEMNTGPRSSPRPARSSAASWTGSPSTGSAPRSGRNWSSSSSRTPTNRPGTRATAG